MNQNQDKNIKSNKTNTGAIIIAVVIALLIAGIAGAYAYITANPTPWFVKWQIKRYLKKQTGKSEFKVDFKFPSEKEMSTIPAELKEIPVTNLIGQVTKKDYKALQTEVQRLSKIVSKYQEEVRDIQTQIAKKTDELKKFQAQGTNTTSSATVSVSSNVESINKEISLLRTNLTEKLKQLAEINKNYDTHLKDLQGIQQTIANARAKASTLPPTNELVIAQGELLKKTRQKLNEANTYRAMYEVIGQELWVADKLLQSVHPAHRKIGISIARQAALDSQNFAENYWLSARIYEAYLLPNLADATDVSWKMPLSMENVINESVQAFRNVEETNNIMRAYQTMIEATGGSARADWSRLQLALLNEQLGNYDLAVKYLKDIKATNNFTNQIRRIPALEQRAKEMKNK